MDDGALIPLYEQPALRAALDDVLRPGGLALTDELIAAGRLAAGARVLDVGCGLGATVAHLRSHHRLDAVGIDTSQTLLDVGRARAPDLPLIEARGEQLPIADECFDAVLVECSLSLIGDINAALAEFKRVLKPGGRLLLADIYVRNADALGTSRPIRPMSCLHGALTRAQLEERLAASGLDAGAWEDRSKEVKVFAARLILAGISPAQFWNGVCDDGMDAVARLQPGYFWLVAGKPTDTPPEIAVEMVAAMVAEEVQERGTNG